ncbi:class I SAM-dependent methyltransferase [Streptomyces sp. B1866]|uniref:class I SAM-dependent methyltransferase n=1 Tax=Streptomyces sp. B1866 TaxID=3075431 RepID=UPI00288E747E|nr:class I SAM-dependent methyltransferase [Streptomyces sp. B1866]MDT3395893.1 class I SAM-dependent methyltransferase [Streptomyces sp. B1866]
MGHQDNAAERDSASAVAAYSAPVLAAYDALVLGAVSRFVWRCPAGDMLALYDRNVSARHLEVGPGTGYFLDRCRFPDPGPQVTLVDLSPTVLATAGRRIARYRPAALRRDVLKPMDLQGRRFDSAALNYVLHCLPSGAPEKFAVFDHLLPHLEPGARVFGGTVLAHGVRHTPLSRLQMNLLVRQGVLNNTEDSLDLLAEALRTRFTRHRLAVHGTVALFEAVV